MKSLCLVLACCCLFVAAGRKSDSVLSPSIPRLSSKLSALDSLVDGPTPPSKSDFQGFLQKYGLGSLPPSFLLEESSMANEEPKEEEHTATTTTNSEESENNHAPTSSPGTPETEGEIKNEDHSNEENKAGTSSSTSSGVDIEVSTLLDTLVGNIKADQIRDQAELDNVQKNVQMEQDEWNRQSVQTQQKLNQITNHLAALRNGHGKWNDKISENTKKMTETAVQYQHLLDQIQAGQAKRDAESARNTEKISDENTFLLALQQIRDANQPAATTTTPTTPSEGTQKIAEGEPTPNTNTNTEKTENNNNNEEEATKKEESTENHAAALAQIQSLVKAKAPAQDLYTLVDALEGSVKDSIAQTQNADFTSAKTWEAEKAGLVKQAHILNGQIKDFQTANAQLLDEKNHEEDKNTNYEAEVKNYQQKLDSLKSLIYNAHVKVQKAQVLFNQAQKHRDEKLASIDKIRGYVTESEDGKKAVVNVNVDALGLNCRWVATDWDECSVPCGGGNQARRSECQSYSGVKTDDSCCAEATPIALLTQRCNTDPCQVKEDAPLPNLHQVCETPAAPGRIGINYWAEVGQDSLEEVHLAVSNVRICPDSSKVESARSPPAVKKFSITNSKGVNLKSPMFQLPASYDASISAQRVYREDPLGSNHWVMIDEVHPGTQYTLHSFEMPSA